MDISIWMWAAVLGVIVFMLSLDLLVFHRDAHLVSAKEAGIWTGVWVALGLSFGGYVAWRWGAELGGQYLAGYVIEKSLAVDNIFVFAVIFAAFGIPNRYQHRVLYWGIFGALVLRAIFIAAGAALIHRFDWTLYFFGVLLLFTAWRMWSHRNQELDPTHNRAILWLQRHIPMTTRLDGQRFFTVENGRRVATPLLVTLAAVELADVVFAIDSIPAVFAVTQEPFLVFTSNAFAILGLRSMYFFLADMIRRFEYLSASLTAILGFVGIKMLIVHWVHIPIPISLGVILGILAVAVAASVLVDKRRTALAEAVLESVE